MKTTNQLATQPYANICINKSRLKRYETNDSTPTYYLENGQEFSIELFNPTQSVVLAKITINGKLITQGGLILRNGERVFLERYLDVAKKFKFETYTVSNTEEVKQAIENNGSIKVEFYSEYIPINYGSTTTITTNYPDWTYRPNIFFGNSGTGIGNNFTYTSGSINTQNINYNQTVSNTLSDSGSVNCSALHDGDATLDFMPNEESKVKLSASLGKNKIETGKVEQGSDSVQQFKYIDKQFDSYAFHTIEYKLLPLSQKVNTTDDIKVRQYCGNCGTKAGRTDKYCSSCGEKFK